MPSLDQPYGTNSTTPTRPRGAGRFTLAALCLVLAATGVATASRVNTASAALPRLTTVPTLSTGLGDSACDVLATGVVKCWGRNRSGLLGNGSTSDSGTPVTVKNLTNVKSVSTGGSFACALQRTAAVWCWGDNFAGQLGRTGAASSVPVAVAGLSNTTAVVAADDTGCGLNSDGTVKCWGSNQFGQLGVGMAVGGFRATPTLVPGLTGVVGIAAGLRHFCALRGNGTVMCWGDNADAESGQHLGVTPIRPMLVVGVNNAVSIDVGATTSCALLATGSVVCWGLDLFARITVATIIDPSLPRPVTGISGATQVSVGDGHACALLSNGTATCWGDDGYGELGAGNASGTPRRVAVAGLTGITAIAAGSYATCATLVTRAVKCWGVNWYGQLGKGALDRSTTPVKVVGIADATAIAAGTQHACATLSTGRVKCWGSNYSGNLGNGTTTYDSPTPQTVSGITNADAVIAAGGYSTCVRRAAGATASCWGSNGGGQLGDGTTVNRSVPVNVSKPTPADTFTSLSVGNSSSCARVSSATIWCWGSNSWGQLGDGSTTSSPTPVTVGLFGAASSVSLGDNTACATRTSDNNVLCWGSNAEGTLGRLKTPSELAQSAAPALISAGGAVASVSLGGSSACATKSDGSVECWGANERAQLGFGNIDNPEIAPLPIPTFTGTTDATAVASIAPGLDHSCAVTRLGAVKCWGSNVDGGVGIANTAALQTVPANVQGLTATSPATTATSVAVGYSFSCALMADHTIDCWGANNGGQLGNGDGGSWTPVSVLASGAQPPAVAVTVPWAPAAPVATPHSHSVSLMWAAPANGGSGVTDYVVQVSPDNGAHWTTYADGVHALPGATVTGLVNGHAYRFRVAAHNAKGTGNTGASTASTPRTVPGVPTTLKATGGTKRFTLTWTAPGTGGAPITDYVVQYSLNNGLTWATFNDGVHATTGATVINVYTGIDYVFRVAAKNAAGTGAFSAKTAPAKAH